MPIVIYPQTLNWNYMKQRPQHLMTQFGKIGHTVFFLNQTQSMNSPWKVAENVYVVENEKFFRDKQLPTIRRGKKVVIWTTWPRTWKKVSRYYPDKVIYDCCDEFPQWAKYEDKIIEMADAVVCSAQNIFDRIHVSYPEKKIKLIRNAVDASFLLDGERSVPWDIPIGKPIVGYVGAWAPWIDHELISKLLDTFPDVNFVIVGSSYGDVPVYKKSNLFVLGPKAHEQLPGYIRSFDVAIIPFRYNPITLATNPIKAYEYLAFGINTLSTALPECIGMEPYLTTATSHSDFITKLHSLLTNKPSLIETRSRIDFAQQNTWNERGRSANELIEQILKLEKKRNSRKHSKNL